MKDFIENMEDTAERRLDEMTEGLPTGMFKCGCGRVTELGNAESASENPFSEPICPTCFSEMVAEYKKRNPRWKK